MLVIRYWREDDGSVEGYAKLVEKDRRILQPGETCPVLPIDEGIHWTGNADDSLVISVHAYGRTLRRGYIHGFDVHENSVYRLSIPRLEKSLLAVKALGALGGESSKAALERGVESRYPLVRWESLVALERIEPGLATALMEKAAHDESAEVRARAQAYLGRQAQG